MGDSYIFLQIKRNYCKYDTWYWTGLSCALWSMLYLILRTLLPRKKPIFCNRILALFHGILITFLGINQCVTNVSPFDDPNASTNSDQLFIMAITLGYFMQDLIWCFYYKTETTLMMAHHLFSCFALGRVLFSGYSGHLVSCSLGALELTNPLLQSRWLLRMYSYENTLLFKFVDVTFILLFFIMRTVFGSAYLAFIMLQLKNSWEFKILSVVIYITSWMFVVNIGKYFVAKYLKQKGKIPISEINPNKKAYCNVLF